MSNLTNVVYYSITAIASVLALVSMFHLKDKRKYRGVSSYILILSLYLLACVFIIFFLLESEMEDAYYILVLTLILLFTVLQALIVFSKNLKDGKRANNYSVIFMLGVFQVALSTIPEYRDNFVSILDFNKNGLVFSSGLIFVINTFIHKTLTLIAFYQIYNMLTKYKREFLYSVIAITLFSLSSLYMIYIIGYNIPVILFINYSLHIFIVMLFVFVLEKLYIDTNETDSDVLNYLKATYLIIDEDNLIVDKMHNFDKEVVNPHKYRSFHHFINDSVEVEDGVFIIEKKFYKIIDGGYYNSTKHKIFYFKDLTANYTKRKLFYSKYLIDDLTGCNTRSNLIQNYLNVEALKDTTVAYFDLDKFKQINDNYDHEVGDRLIKHFSEYLIREYSHENVYRLGGDEFVVVTKVHNTAKFVSKTLDNFKVGNTCLQLEYSVGAIYVDNSSKQDILYYVNEAEKKMYICKNNKKSKR